MIHDDKISVNSTPTADQIETMGVGQDGTPRKIIEVAPLQMDLTCEEYRRPNENQNPAPFYTKDVELSEKVGQITDTLRNISTSSMEGYGATVADRPDVSIVPIGFCFMAINDGVINGIDTRQVWQSNGVDWKEL